MAKIVPSHLGKSIARRNSWLQNANLALVLDCSNGNITSFSFQLLSPLVWWLLLLTVSSLSQDGFTVMAARDTLWFSNKSKSKSKSKKILFIVGTL